MNISSYYILKSPYTDRYFVSYKYKFQWRSNPYEIVKFETKEAIFRFFSRHPSEFEDHIIIEVFEDAIKNK